MFTKWETGTKPAILSLHEQAAAIQPVTFSLMVSSHA
jgi:hypothetical protein